MERAQRAADSPMRAILEAARLRRRVEAESPGELDAGARRANVPRAMAAGVDDSPVITIRTLGGESLPVAPARSNALAPASLAPLRSASALALPPELPRLLPWPAAAAAALRPPELVQMVEPEMTPRLQELLLRPDVAVEFTIQPDGRVSGVQVLPPVPRALVPVIAQAVEQWRYAPLPAPRLHRVQLVFKTGTN